MDNYIKEKEIYLKITLDRNYSNPKNSSKLPSFIVY